MNTEEILHRLGLDTYTEHEARDVAVSLTELQEALRLQAQIFSKELRACWDSEDDGFFSPLRIKELIDKYERAEQ